MSWTRPLTAQQLQSIQPPEARAYLQDREAQIDALERRNAVLQDKLQGYASTAGSALAAHGSGLPIPIRDLLDQISLLR